MWNLGSASVLEHTSPALEGGFLTVGPPGKSPHQHLWNLGPMVSILVLINAESKYLRLIFFLISRNTLTVQWLGFCTSTAGGMGLIPSQRTKIPHAVGLSKNKQTNKPWILKIPQKDESFITCICTQVFCRLFYELSLHASYLSCEVLLWTVPQRLWICSLSWGIVSPNHKYVVFDWASQVVLEVKNPPASEGDADSIPGSGRSPGRGHGNPLQYSCLENPMDSGAWQATVHGVAKSWTRLQRLSMRQYLILSAIRSKSSATRDLFWVGFFTLHQMA